MELITLLDKLIIALENGEFTIGVFLDFPKASILILIKSCLMNYIAMVYVELQFPGAKVIRQIDINLLHTMA